MRKSLMHIVCLSAFFAVVGLAQSGDDAEMVNKIRAEETNNSKAMWIIHEIADVHGSRVTGTPNLRLAQDWALKTLVSFGLQNAHLEPWSFQPPSAAAPVAGWDNLELQADAVYPFHGQLIVKPLAWTPSTKGVVTAEVVQITPPGMASPNIGAQPGGPGGGGRGTRNAPVGEPAAITGSTAGTPPPMPTPVVVTPAQQPTREELEAYFNNIKDKVRGHIVLVGKAIQVPENFNPAPLRRTDDEWKAQFDPNNPNAGRGQFGGGGRGPTAPLPPGQLTTQEVARAVDQFLVENGALVRINDAGRPYGLIIAQQNNTYDWTRTVPTLIMRNEDYGRISRILADGSPVTVRVNIQNKLYPEGVTAYNVIAEIPGTDKKDEIVMLGGHYDSWHDATGATDNGIGSTMMMEAVRILTALKVKPRRTIRIALWSGEEQGLLGSIAYVKEHFGSAEEPKPEFSKLDCYFNIDSGTSKPRGAGVFGPSEAAAMVGEAFMPFKDWGFMGYRASNSRVTAGTDSTSFNNAGLPGVGLNQDPFDYNSHTHHTNFDTYERIYEEDVREGAAEIAFAVYKMAMADKMVPRFKPEEMPKPAPVPLPGSTYVPPYKPSAIVKK
jgi:carboxypeptidase Q